MRTTTGTIVEAPLVTLVNRIYGVRIVYYASKMEIEAVVDATKQFLAPVRAQIWPGMYITGFKIGVSCVRWPCQSIHSVAVDCPNNGCR